MGSMRELVVCRHHSSRSGPGWRVVVQELLKSFLEKVSTHGFQVIPEQVAEAEPLRLQILFTFERSQREKLSSGVWASLAMARDYSERTSWALFISATIWKRSKRICRAWILADDFQIGFPHVRADEHDLGGDFFTHGSEESLKRLDGSLLADPK